MANILITGASTGIGYSTSKYLIQKGYKVIGSVRKEADASRLKNELGDNFYPLIFDVTDEEAIKRSVSEVESITGSEGLTALINNAGIVVSGPLMHVDVSDFEHQMNVNVLGVLRVSKAFLPLLGAQKPAKYPPGKIINISSVSAIFTNPFVVPYCASKKALEAITEGLRRELLIYGIDVVSILPGPIDTPIWDKADTGNNYEGTDYELIMKSTKKMMDNIQKRALPPEKLAKLLHEVIIGKKKKVSYIITGNPWPMRLAGLLPSRWLDKIIKKQFDKALK